MERLQYYINLTKRSEINSYVIDLKGVDGIVNYESKIPAVRMAKAFATSFNLSKVINAFHQNNIHVIGRIVCFKDPYLSVQKPEWAVNENDGKLYNEKWLNPTNQEVWKYLVDIAKESLAKGVDEIQFDYVRFPFDGDTGKLALGVKVEERYKIIDDFISCARKQMPKAVLSADVFGIICQSVNDPEHIGQNLEYIGKELDYISPMIYPSLFAKGQIVNDIILAKPDLAPYAVVYNTLLNGNRRIARVKDYRAKIRPYLQAYTASWLGDGEYQQYGADQLKQQIKAAHDAGCDQWIFWNEQSNYPEGAFY